MAGEFGQMTSIARQEGDRVLVSLPMIGFPPGYTLPDGARVVLVFDENGPAVRPAVVPVPLGSAEPQVANGALTARGKRLNVPENIVRDDSGSGEYVAFVVGSDEGEQVIAVRRQPES